LRQRATLMFGWRRLGKDLGPSRTLDASRGGDSPESFVTNYHNRG
jgi:hypothetical protein